jgi:hypothetical protein
LLTGERASYPGIDNVPFSIHLTAVEPLDVPVERFLASLRFEQREKLEQLGIEIDSSD